MAGLTDNPFGNARVYYELFDGVIDEDEIRAVDLHLQIGGSAANIYYSQFQVSLYARAGGVDSDNVATLYRALVTRPAGEDFVDVYVKADIAQNLNVNCVVLKLEATEVNSIVQLPAASKLWQDQWYAADPAPWEVRLKGSAIYASDDVRRVTPKRVVADILDPFSWTLSAPGLPSFAIDQLSFTDIPKTRHEALDDVNAMLGWDYYIWPDYPDGAETYFTMQKPGRGTVRRPKVTDPSITFDLAENIDDTFNAVRVKYTSRLGRAREVIVHGDSRALGSTVKATVLDAPDSCRSERAATRIGQQYLGDHSKPSVSGTLTVTGISYTFGDALLARPGDVVTLIGAGSLPKKMKATHVTLNPLDWTADISFEVAPWRFDRWLARLAAGAHARNR